MNAPRSIRKARREMPARVRALREDRRIVRAFPSLDEPKLLYSVRPVLLDTRLVPVPLTPPRDHNAERGWIHPRSRPIRVTAISAPPPELVAKLVDFKFRWEVAHGMHGPAALDALVRAA